MLKKIKEKLYVRNELLSFLRFRGLTVPELSDMIKVTEFTLNGIITGKYVPSLYLALLICAALDCNIEDIFYLEVFK